MAIALPGECSKAAERRNVTNEPLPTEPAEPVVQRQESGKSSFVPAGDKSGATVSGQKHVTERK